MGTREGRLPSQSPGGVCLPLSFSRLNLAGGVEAQPHGEGPAEPGHLGRSPGSRLASAVVHAGSLAFQIPFPISQG